MTTIYIMAIVGFCSIFGGLTVLALWFGGRLMRDMTACSSEQTMMTARKQQAAWREIRRK